MRRRLIQIGLILLALASTSGTSRAGVGGCGTAPFMQPFAFETLTVSSTSKALTATVYNPAGGTAADMATIVVETDSVRHREDGLAPTASVGQLVLASATAPANLTVCGLGSMQAVRFIRVTTDASLSVSYYRQTN